MTISAVVEAAQIPWPRLGELLVQSGLITERELKDALTQQALTAERLGEILVARGVVSFRDLTNTLMEQLGREIVAESALGSTRSATIQRRDGSGQAAGRESAESEIPKAATSDARKLAVGPNPEELLERTADALEIIANRIRSSLGAGASNAQPAIRRL